MVHPVKKPKPNTPASPRPARSAKPSPRPTPTLALPASTASSSKGKAKASEMITIDDSDDEIEVIEESEDSQVEFVYDSDIVISEVEDEEPSLGFEPMSVSEDDDQSPPSPPPELGPPKPKGGSRKIYKDHINRLVELYGTSSGTQVKGLRQESDESVNFNLMTPARKKGLPLVILTPEVGGYPDQAQHFCYSEDDVDSVTEQVLEEVSALPAQADRSLLGVINHLILRLVLREPSPWANLVDQDPSDNEYESDDDMFGLGVGDVSEQVAAFSAAVRKDMRQVLSAGYRCGFHRVSELDNIVVCSVRVHDLGVPLRALQAWDSNLITGEVVYLVMLINFGARYPVNMDDMSRGQVRVKVGLSPKYKPNHQAIGAAFRNHSSAYTTGEFESFALSAPLDSLFAEKFQEIVACRRKYAVGWAGAEQYAFALDKKAGFDNKAATKADNEEKEAAASYKMPADPQATTATADNFPLTAFAYLLRRFMMCPKFCLICYKAVEFSSLKPFVCNNELCLYQLMNLDLAVSLENELLTNPASVDLLVSLCYSAAIERGLKDASHFPYGLGLQVPVRTPWSPGDPTSDFDSFTTNDEKCKGIYNLISELPKISAMRSWILKEDVADTDKVLYHARKLQDMPGASGKTASPSAWKLLRWIVASCTSYLKEITEGDELVQGLNKQYRQFKLLVGSPIKEHQLAEHVKKAKARNANATKYPTLHAFHGSSVKNWHTILREGLHFRETINGRAYGHGVYFAKQGDISLGHYSQPAGTSWKQSEFTVGKVAAICEIVNLPSEFVSKDPYLVVQHTEWIQARYLVVAKTAGFSDPAADGDSIGPHAKGHYIPMDPAHPLTLGQAQVLIPDIVPKLEELNKKLAWEEDPLNNSDDELLKDPPAKSTTTPSAIKPLRTKRSLGPSSSIASAGDAATRRGTRGAKPSPDVDGQAGGTKADEHEPFEPVGQSILSMVRMLPPPKAPNRGALLSITKEIKVMVDEQEKEGPVKCGYYFDPERSNDNAFNWIVEMPIASFDQSIPLVADCKQKKVTGILFEIRFGESYPLAPPFFRVVYPRFLPFIQGGGGHVTGGGSICMDLLTPNAWNPIYSTSAVLLQIRMAISNLEPRPARLDTTSWSQPYSMAEAIEGFKRAASTHGWSVPADLDRMKY